jgi:hypothetical protein
MPSFGTLKADTLTHSTAGSLATNFVVQGSGKAWCEFNGQSTVAISDSFNIGSLTDAGTGLYDLTFTNSMNNAGFASTGAAGERLDNGGNRSCGLRAKSTGGQNIRGFRDGVSADDFPELCFHTMGDLA